MTVWVVPRRANVYNWSVAHQLEMGEAPCARRNRCQTAVIPEPLPQAGGADKP